MQKAIKKNSIAFLSFIFILMIFFTIIAIISFYFLQNNNLVLYKVILNIILIVAVFFSIYMLINGIWIVFLMKGKKISFFPQRWLKSSLGILYSNIAYLSKLVHFDINKVRNIFTDLNNRVVLTNNKKTKPEDILILLPHCLQNTACSNKITSNIDNCKKCGLCIISTLIDIRDRYNTEMFVATGGTLARRIIKEKKPEAVIAVACERDLSSGILDVKKVPVIGILNERPYGPCINTTVNVKNIEKAIQLFIGEGE